MKVLIVFALTLIAVNAASIDSLLRPGFPEGRVINGQNAVKGAAPYIVSLQTTGLFGGHFCAGSLISPNLVLTAAHCLIYNKFNVVAGLHIRSDTSNVQVREVLSSSQYRQHEKYGGGVGPNDIGLIYVPQGFVLNTLKASSAPVATINLPSGKYAQTGRGKLFGWGRDKTGASPQILQTLDVDVIGYSQCKAELPSSAPLNEASNICTHTPNKIDGACNGDSGGPLIINTQAGAELVGIVSWGYTPCHQSTYPSVYTKVSGFQQWIEETSAKLVRG